MKNISLMDSIASVLISATNISKSNE
jgi:hypothetical protein